MGWEAFPVLHIAHCQDSFAIHTPSALIGNLVSKSIKQQRRPGSIVQLQSLLLTRAHYTCEEEQWSIAFIPCLYPFAPITMQKFLDWNMSKEQWTRSPTIWDHLCFPVHPGELFGHWAGITKIGHSKAAKNVQSAKTNLLLHKFHAFISVCGSVSEWLLQPTLFMFHLPTACVYPNPLLLHTIALHLIWIYRFCTQEEMTFCVERSVWTADCSPLCFWASCQALCTCLTEPRVAWSAKNELHYNNNLHEMKPTGYIQSTEAHRALPQIPAQILIHVDSCECSAFQKTWCSSTFKNKEESDNVLCCKIMRRKHVLFCFCFLLFWCKHGKKTCHGNNW